MLTFLPARTLTRLLAVTIPVYFAWEMLRQLRPLSSQAPLAPTITTVGTETSTRALVVRVVRIVDGDTIRVCCIAGQEEPVRYIGMDTPEMHYPTRGQDPGAVKATEANRQLVEGQHVRPELDVQERDRYKRVLDAAS